MTPDELKARLMAAVKHSPTFELIDFVEDLLDTVIKQQAALEDLMRFSDCNNYPEHEVRYHLCVDVPGEANEALTATRERLKAWVGDV